VDLGQGRPFFPIVGNWDPRGFAGTATLNGPIP
jgi:hypothetical protein